MDEVFRAVTDLLRTKHDRERGFEPYVLNRTTDGSHGNKSATLALLHDRIASVEYPRLSLRHEGHLNMHQSSRDQAQMEAASLLARPVLVEANSSDDSQDDPFRMEDLPPILMNNLYESFAILVDSRLHVYGKVFLRHLKSLITKRADSFGIMQMGQKLETLHDIGGQITAETMEMQVDLEDQDIEEVTPGFFQQAIRLEASMELHVPSPSGSNRTLVVHHKGQGFIKGIVRDSDSKIQLSLEVDSKRLLSSMMDQASLMVAKIVETTNEAFAAPEPKLPRGASFFVMPPPLPRKQPAAPAGLDLLSQAASVKDSAVITPDLGAKKADASLVPLLRLHEDGEEEEDPDVDDLSVDQCASIIDDVFGGMNDTIFGCMDDTHLQGPPLKKMKTSP